MNTPESSLILPESHPVLADPNMRLAMVSRGIGLSTDMAGYILDSSGLLRSDINVLVVPTAANTPGAHKQYISEAEAAFARVKNVAVLHDYDQEPTETQIDHEFGTADVVWFTGGRTQKLIPIFKNTGADIALFQAAATKVISGGSAGSILQSLEGMSHDTPRDAEGNIISEEYVTIGGFALAKVLLCVHQTLVDTEPNKLNKLSRQYPFTAMLNNRSFMSLSPNAPTGRAASLIIGIDNNSSAFLNRNGIQARSGSGAQDEGISIYDINDEGLYDVKARILPGEGVVPYEQLLAA